jgi:hypothetical protein
MAAAMTNRVRCRNCGRHVSPVECSGADERGWTCPRCIEWHLHALEFMGGAIPKGCQSCERAWEDIRAEALRDAEKENAVLAEARIYVVPKDGILELLCRRCVTPYIQKRKDLYRGTAFGDAMKL